MYITITAIESCMGITDCITEEIRKAMSCDEYIGMLSELILCVWPSTKLQPYWSIRDEIAIIDGIAMKGRRIIIHAVLQDRVLKQLHLSHMGTEKTLLLACKSIYWINMNVDIEEMIKNCPTCLDFQAT